MSTISENIAIIRAALDDIEAGSAPVAKANPFAKGRQTLNQTFATRPTFAASKAMPLGAAAVPGFDDPKFGWRAGYVNAGIARGLDANAWRLGKPYPGFCWLSNNKELASYPNQDAIALTGADPINSDGQNLVLTAKAPPPAYIAALPAGVPTDYFSGAINSFPYAQAYGVFEMVAQIPKGRGLWPAFWMLPVDLQWPPEIDIMEVLGHDTRTVYTTVHSVKGDSGPAKGSGQPTTLTDLSDGFHKYALRWTAETLTWAVDDQIVFSVATPASLVNRPCYLLANLAVGGPGSWPGAPDKDTVFPAEMKIRSIQAWANPT